MRLQAVQIETAAPAQYGRAKAASTRLGADLEEVDAEQGPLLEVELDSCALPQQLP